MAFQASREMATRAPKDRKVAILGAAGGIGQPLSLLMKVGSLARGRLQLRARDLKASRSNYLLLCSQMNPAVTQLSLYDVANVKGVAADVSHINSRAKVEVSGFSVAAGLLSPGSSRLRQLVVPAGF